MDLFKLLDVSSPKIIRDTLNKTITAFNILEEYATETANNALDISETARTIAEQALQNSNSAVDTANNAEEQSRSAIDTAVYALGIANTASTDASTALEVSNRASLDSAQAVAVSNTASANANNALEKATTAVSASDTANANASTALSNSTQAINTADSAYQKAEYAIATANESKTESAFAKSVAYTAEANSVSAVNTATTAVNTSATAEQNAHAALETAQEALKHVVDSVGTQVSVNGEAVTIFNADVKADVTYVDQKVADLIGSAPDTLDTLAELSGALKNNKDIVTVLEDAIATKANSTDVNATFEEVNTLIASNTAAFENYLPLTAGSTKKLTSSLYLNNNAFIKSYTTQDGLRNLIGVNTSSMIELGDTGANIGVKAASNIRPASHNATTLGTSTSQWKEIYGTKIYQNGSEVVDLSTEQTVSGTKKFTANNNTFTRTLVLGANTPINFTGIGAGTYNIGAFVCNTIDKFGVECPRESDSGSAPIIPFRVGARGGQLGILQAGDIYQNGKQVANKEDVTTALGNIETALATINRGTGV